MTNYDDIRWEEMRDEEERRAGIEREEMLKQDILREQINSSKNWWEDPTKGNKEDPLFFEYDRSPQNKKPLGLWDILKSNPMMLGFVVVVFGVGIFYLALFIMGK